MTTKIHAVKLSAGALPVTTAPLTIASTWAPAVYTPPALDVPTGLAALSIADAAVISWVPTPGCQTVIETAPDVSGSPGTWTVRTQTADSTYTLPIPAGIAIHVRIKAVRYGRSSAYSTSVMAAALIFGAGPGRNLIGNMSFETVAIGHGTGGGIRAGTICNLFDAVAAPEVAGTVNTFARLSTFAVRTGSYSCQLTLSGQSLPAGAILYSTRIKYMAPITLPTTKAALVRVRLRVVNNAGLSGCTLAVNANLQFFNSSNAVISTITATATSQTFDGLISARGTVPAGTVRTELYFQTAITNGTGSTQVLTGIPAEAYFDDVEVFLLSNLDEDVEDGTTHGRIAMQDVYQTSGVNRLGVAVATSGQQVTTRNIPATLSASGGSLWDGLTIDTEFTAASPAVVTVTVGAATLRASGYSPAYSSAAATVNQTRGTTVRYYAYYDDPTLAGGTKTLVLSTARLDTVNAAGRVFISSFEVTVPASGTGTGSGGNNGGGGSYIP